MLDKFRTTWRPAALLAAVVLIALTGLVHGLWTNRWSENQELLKAKATLAQISLPLGDWQGREQQQIDAARLEQAGIVGHVRRVYAHQEHEQSIGMLLMCGEPGPISVHTPETCYRGAGYEIVGEAQRVKVQLPQGQSAELFTARFHKPRSSGTPPLRIFWTWNAGEGWQAPQLPRFTFRKAKALYKLYAIREMTSVQESIQDDSIIPFLEQALPQLQKELFLPHANAHDG